jgi:hypothetical protein
MVLHWLHIKLLKFLDQRVTLLSSSSRHFDVVSMATASLAVDAFSCGIRHDALTTAVEMVEQGRAVFWTHLARFRTTLDELSMARHTGAALAEEFKQLSFRLRSTFDQSTEDQFPQIRQLTMQWNDVVSRICMLPDFSRFLRPPLFSDLQKAAEEGPVIIVNASQYSCDVLIVLSDRDFVHVPISISRRPKLLICPPIFSLFQKNSVMLIPNTSLLGFFADSGMTSLTPWYKPLGHQMFILARVYGGVPLLNSRCFLYTQQEPTKRRETICLTSTFPRIPHFGGTCSCETAGSLRCVPATFCCNRSRKPRRGQASPMCCFRANGCRPTSHACRVVLHVT